MAKKKQDIEIEIEDNNTFSAFLSDDNDDDQADYEDAKGKTATTISFEVDPYSGDAMNEYGPGLEEEYLKGKNTPATVEVEVDEDDEEPEAAKPEQKPAKKAEPVIVEDEVDEPEVKPEPKKAKNSSQERIRELAREKRAAEALASENARKLQETNAFYAKREITLIEKEIAACKLRLQTAIENNDAEAIVAAQTELLESIGDLSKLRDIVGSLPKEAPAKEKPAATEYSQAAQDWMAGKEFLLDNNEYKALKPDDRKKLYPVRQALVGMVRELHNEGFSTDDYDFYEELDIRLSQKFDFYEGLASMGIDALHSSGEDSVKESKPSSSADVKQPQKRTSTEKTRQVPVQGPATSGSTTSSSSPKPKVKLTSEHMRWYENHVKPHGVSLQEYAAGVFEEEKKGSR